MTQKEGESVTHFARRLRHQANLCEYGDALNMRITEQIFDGSCSNTLREAILKKRLVDLANIIEEGRVLETINSNQQEAVGEDSASVNKVRSEMKSAAHRCFRCGSSGHYANDKKCPARKKTCDKCGLIGHFKKLCKTKKPAVDKKKKVRQVADSEEESHSECEDYVSDNESDASDIYHIFSTATRERKKFSSGSDDKYNTKVKCLVGGVPLQWTVDSGASVNLIDEYTWNKLKQNGCKVSFETNETRKKLVAYGNHKLHVKGMFKADIKHGSLTVHSEIFVVNGQGASLLGKTSSIDLGVLKINCDVLKITEEKSVKIGKAKDLLVTINIDRKIYPVQQPCRRLPIPLQKTVDEEIQKLLEQGIIEPVTGKITWASPLVVTPKDGGRRVRLCVDMRRANAAIIPQRHPLLTFEELMPYLDGCKYFSKIDLNQAFHQLELDPESREITTFVTTKGYYRFKRLMFGMNCAAEIFQRELERILKGLDGVVHFIDDILVFGRSKAEHDRRVAAVMKRLISCGLTINEDKCQWGRKSVTFLGHELSQDGILPTEQKVSAVKSFRCPETSEEVRSFLGLVNYVGKFIPNLSTITTPLREITRKGVKFQWTDEANKSFVKIKDALSNPQHLGFYNAESDTTLVVDASATGLGAVLLQSDEGKRQVISYASRSLSKTEQKYSVLDKEAMAIYWGIGRFEMYLRGKDFTVVTDHKPLVKIFSVDSAPNARQQRWVLQLQGYRYKLVYAPGKTNIADPLSRLAQCSAYRSSDRDCESDLCATIECALPTTMSMTEVIQGSEDDEEFRKIRDAINSGKWSSELKRYLPFQNELCCMNQIILRLNKIVIPERLRAKVLDLAHSGHPGSNKMKRRLRASVWWPGIDKDVEKRCKMCRECQAVGRSPNPEPLQIRAMPAKPWSHLSGDFLGPLPNGKFLFVLVDYYSRYCVVEIMSTTTSAMIIQRLERIFTRLGLPDVLTTDNAANFCSQEFRDFCVDNGIKLAHTTPYWPAANGEVERQNRSILKALRIGQMKGELLERSLQEYLYMYTVTPHSVTGVSPAELMFGRRFREKFPQVSDNSILRDEIRDRDLIHKYHAKMYRDKRVNALESNIGVGDQVLMKNQHRVNKLAPNFHAKPAVVIGRNGSSVTIQTEEGEIFRRNSSHLKRIHQDSSNPQSGQRNSTGIQDATSTTDLTSIIEGRTQLQGVDEVNRKQTEPSPTRMTETVGVSIRPRRQSKVPVKYQDYDM
ncbi:uncharacterized protein K02A2.6-like [Topomyia yanbarensis]|uniref:uncharacterized protein K02A2.6-like n=1 Tax=Topomyia yanbarensis TaxID=2498891 RepID=UPI00273BE52D|nr:uncharacterized protein K02A2.6-like [Topomyia yanbarensis]